MKSVQRFLEKLRTAFSGGAEEQLSCTETGCIRPKDARRTIGGYIPARDHCSNISNCQL
ncbi:MAG TPA: hypothetical protein VLA21_01475 [Candidatus Limnocylindria bacterium]|nr:hypothetical protein [Candidatus Limnocylindria bacterium]